MGAGECSRVDGAQLEEAVQRARAGDEEAWTELYRAFHRPVFHQCRYLLGSGDAAEDAASEVFLRAKRAMMSFDTTLSFPSWLAGIAGNYCVDRLRRRGLEQRIFEPAGDEAREPAGAGPSPLAELLTAESRETVRRAVATLEPRYRLPLVLRYYSEQSYDEIAATLGVSRGHVAVLIHRAKLDLRRKLDPARGGRMP